MSRFGQLMTHSQSGESMPSIVRLYILPKTLVALLLQYCTNNNVNIMMPEDMARKCTGRTTFNVKKTRTENTKYTTAGVGLRKKSHCKPYNRFQFSV